MSKVKNRISIADEKMGFFEKEDKTVLISYGKLNTKLLETEIEVQIDKFKREIGIEGKCKRSRIFSDKIPKLFISCRNTRFGKLMEPKEKGLSEYYSFTIEIPLSSIYKEIDCKFLIHNETYDILQFSEIYKIKLDEEIEQNYPSVIWLDFNEKDLKDIKNLYWYIKADKDSDLYIAFNSSKKNFKKAIETNSAPNFRKTFFYHFRQAYVTALIYGTDMIDDTSLEELCNTNRPYHYKIAEDILDCKISEDRRWKRFAFIMQEITGIRSYLEMSLEKELKERYYDVQNNK